MKIKRILPLLLLAALTTPGCAMMQMQHRQAMQEWENELPYWRVERAKQVEAEYAQYFEQKIAAALAPIFGPEHFKVSVYIQLDFDDSSSEAIWYPNDKQSKEERLHQRQEAEKGGRETEESKEIRYKISSTETETDIHPGRIQMLNISVLIDAAAATRFEDADSLKDRLVPLIAAISPFREDRGDVIVVEVFSFLR